MADQKIKKEVKGNASKNPLSSFIGKYINTTTIQGRANGAKLCLTSYFLIYLIIKWKRRKAAAETDPPTFLPPASPDISQDSVIRVPGSILPYEEPENSEDDPYSEEDEVDV